MTTFGSVSSTIGENIVVTPVAQKKTFINGALTSLPSPISPANRAPKKFFPKCTIKKTPTKDEIVVIAPSVKKRKRSGEENLTDEVADLTLDPFDKPLDSRRGGRTRRVRYGENDMGEKLETTLVHRPKDISSLGPIKFEFVAICDYHNDGMMHEHFFSSELKDIVADLWARHRHMRPRNLDEGKG